MRGKGGFFGDVLSGVGDVAKGFIHPGDFSKIGGRVGSGLGNVLSKVTGMGDYTIRKNSIVERMPVGQNGELDKRFSFADSGTSTIRVKKREYLGQVLAGANPDDFQQIQYRLQATDPATFPWMATIGELFTEWRLIGGIFSFETTSSNYSSSVGLGTIAMATQYNSNMLPYADMDSVLQSAFHTRGNPSENLIHGIECDPKLQASERLFTRRPGASGPPNLYDHGVVTVATQGLDSGIAAGTSMGRIYFTYDIELSLPELPVAAPYKHSIGITNNQANSAVLPPAGPALTMTALAASEMTVSASSGSNILLLAPATGPLVKPTQTPANEAELMCWINDSSGTPALQYISFARAGHYLLQILRSDVGGAAAAFVEGDTVCLALTDTIVTSVFGSGAGGATDFVRPWYFHIEVTVASGAVTLQNFNAVADSGTMIISLTE